MRESFTLVCLKIPKHGNPVGHQRIMGLIYYMYQINRLFHPQIMLFSFEVKRLTKAKVESPTGDQFLISGRQ